MLVDLATSSERTPRVPRRSMPRIESFGGEAQSLPEQPFTPTSTANVEHHFAIVKHEIVPKHPKSS